MDLVPLLGEGLVVGEKQPIDDSRGRHRLPDRPDRRAYRQAHVVRLYVPLLDGADRVGVLAFTAGRRRPSTTGGWPAGWPA